MRTIIPKQPGEIAIRVAAIAGSLRLRDAENVIARRRHHGQLFRLGNNVWLCENARPAGDPERGACSFGTSDSRRDREIRARGGRSRYPRDDRRCWWRCPSRWRYLSLHLVASARRADSIGGVAWLGLASLDCANAG